MSIMLTIAEHNLTDHSAAADNDKPAPALASRFILGDWQICPELNRLQCLRGNLQRAIEPRLMHLLCYLAANPDRVLSRDELVQELWPRVIVNENSLTRAMSELRKHLTLSDNPGNAYIETIPKKGYRLLQVARSCTTQPHTPATRAQEASTTARAESGVPALPQPAVAQSWLPNWQLPVRHAVAAMCLSLVLGAWIGLQQDALFTDSKVTTRQLADEVSTTQPDYLGGEITLSTANNPEVMGHGIKTVEAPVLSNDESQYAYIQRDNAGSTIFLGRLDALAAPVVAVYNSPEQLFNLTWSPLGHSLIFARQSKLTTAALYPDDRKTAELIMLDLSTLEVHRLLPDMNPTTNEVSKPQNLT